MASHPLAVVYLVSDHEGYTNVSSGKIHCVDDIVLAILRDGELPFRARCAADDDRSRE